MTPPGGQFAPEAPGRFFGKYRALVTENVDPLNLARIKVNVPAVPGTAETWALPCIPYAGNGKDPVGFHAIPPLGAHVWIEFEGGDPSHPIWVGCYWEKDQFKDPSTINKKEPPRVKIWKTLDSDFILDDTEKKGGITLQVDKKAVDTKVILKFDSKGVLIETGVCRMTMNPKEKKTVLEVSDTTITMTEKAIELKTETVKIDASKDITIKAGTTLVTQSGTDTTAKAGKNLTLKASANLAADAGANLDAKAGAMGTFKASAQLTLDGGGMLIAKGGLVKIN